MLSKEHQGWISKIHHNLGHPNVQKLQNVLKQQGYSDEIIQGTADFCCNICHETQAARIARPATLSDVRDFNDCVGCDLVTWTSKSDKNHQFLHVVDSASNFQLAMPLLRTDADSLFEAFKTFGLNGLDHANSSRLTMHPHCVRNKSHSSCKVRILTSALLLHTLTGRWENWERPNDMGR